MEESGQEVITGENTDQKEQAQPTDQSETEHAQERPEQPGHPDNGVQQVEVMNQVEMYYPLGIEGIDYHTYTGTKTALIVRHEVTYGDILLSTLLAFLVIVQLIKFFHGLMLGGGRK